MPFLVVLVLFVCAIRKNCEIITETKRITQRNIHGTTSSSGSSNSTKSFELHPFWSRYPFRKRNDNAKFGTTSEGPTVFRLCILSSSDQKPLLLLPFREYVLLDLQTDYYAMLCSTRCI